MNVKQHYGMNQSEHTGKVLLFVMNNKPVVYSEFPVVSLQERLYLRESRSGFQTTCGVARLI